MISFGFVEEQIPENHQFFEPSLYWITCKHTMADRTSDDDDDDGGNDDGDDV